MLIVKNCRYLSEDLGFVTGNIGIENDKIVQLGDFCGKEEDRVLDVHQALVIPGLIDIHIHGSAGYGVIGADEEDLRNMSEYLAKCGTTSYLPTTMTAGPEELMETLSVIRKYSEEEPTGATVEGVHLEGPYIAASRKGCHDERYIRVPSREDAAKYAETLGGRLHLHFTVAPEIQGAEAFIRYLKGMGATVSVGHTDASEKTVLRALDSGADSFTHLYNAMSGVDHREPGAAVAALCSKAYVELICDGVHVHPSMIDLTCRVKERDKIILVTDAMQAAGCGDGEYEFGGFRVLVRDGIARREDGTLASSTLSMLEAVKNVMKFAGVSLEEAVRMATENPARAVGIYDHAGSIAVNKRADLLVLDDSLNLRTVYCRGKELNRSYHFAG